MTEKCATLQAGLAAAAVWDDQAAKMPTIVARANDATGGVRSTVDVRGTATGSGWKQVGGVEVPQEAFLAVLNLDSERKKS